MNKSCRGLQAYNMLCLGLLFSRKHNWCCITEITLVPYDLVDLALSLSHNESEKRPCVCVCEWLTLGQWRLRVCGWPHTSQWHPDFHGLGCQGSRIHTPTPWGCSPLRGRSQKHETNYAFEWRKRASLDTCIVQPLALWHQFPNIWGSTKKTKPPHKQNHTQKRSVKILGGKHGQSQLQFIWAWNNTAQPLSKHIKLQSFLICGLHDNSFWSQIICSIGSFYTDWICNATSTFEWDQST